MPSYAIAALITSLHNLFTAAWIGGMLSLGLATLPAVKKTLGASPQTQQVVYAIYKRLQVVAKVSILGLLVTGVLLSRRAAQWQGPFSTGNTYSALLAAKHVLVVLMLALAAARSLMMERIARAGKPTAGQNKALAALLLANIVLGVAVLVLSGFGSVVGEICVVPR
jgi:uncharacterized membrane protein